MQIDVYIVNLWIKKLPMPRGHEQNFFAARIVRRDSFKRLFIYSFC